MLYLTRKIGESIVINDDIEITVVDIRGKSIKLGLTFPADVTVYRREVYERIKAERLADGVDGKLPARPRVVAEVEIEVPRPKLAGDGRS